MPDDTIAVATSILTMIAEDSGLRGSHRLAARRHLKALEHASRRDAEVAMGIEDPDDDDWPDDEREPPARSPIGWDR
jgi:hypothetical protein